MNNREKDSAIHQEKQHFLKKNPPKSILKSMKPQLKSSINTVDQITSNLNFGFDPSHPIMQNPKEIPQKYPLLDSLDSNSNRTKSVNFINQDKYKGRLKPDVELESFEKTLKATVFNAQNLNSETQNIANFSKGFSGRKQVNNLPAEQFKSAQRQNFKIKPHSRSQHTRIDQNVRNNMMNQGDKMRQQELNQNNFAVYGNQVNLLERKPPLISNNATTSMYGGFRNGSGSNNLHNRYMNMGSGLNSNQNKFGKTLAEKGGFERSLFGGTNYMNKFKSL